MGGLHLPDGETSQQNTAATAILVGTIVLVILINLTLFFGVLTGSIDGQEMIGAALLATLSLPIDPKWISGVAAILAIGSAYAAAGKLPDKFYYLIIVILVIAALTTVVVLISLTSEGVASKLYNWATVERLADAQGFKSTIYWLFGGVLGWLIVTIGTLVGVKRLGE